MLIDDYLIEDEGAFGLTVTSPEGEKSFFLDGDEAEIFRCELTAWRLKTGESVDEFITAHDYDLLFN